ncbi:Uncharacterised protein [Vibrio cholerae]|nr:Uncharacterised protein [Vibrio cholerae]
MLNTSKIFFGTTQRRKIGANTFQRMTRFQQIQLSFGVARQ